MDRSNEKTSETPRLAGPPLEVKDLNKQYKAGTWANRDQTITDRAPCVPLAYLLPGE